MYNLNEPAKKYLFILTVHRIANKPTSLKLFHEEVVLILVASLPFLQIIVDIVFVRNLHKILQKFHHDL